MGEVGAGTTYQPRLFGTVHSSHCRGGIYTEDIVKEQSGSVNSSRENLWSVPTPLRFSTHHELASGTLLACLTVFLPSCGAGAHCVLLGPAVPPASDL